MTFKLHHIIFLLIVSAMISCYTRTEGCLDALASNYDVSSDDECIDCCTYPQLILYLDHMVGDSVFSSKDTLTNILGQQYRIVDIKYYFSGFLLSSATNGNTPVIESISNVDNSIVLPDDIKICKLSDDSISFGTVRDYGIFNGVQFHLGLSDTIINTSFSDLPRTHTLQPLYSLRNANDELVNVAIRIQRKIDTFEILNFYFNSPDLYKTLTIDSTITTTKGRNFAFRIKADYMQLCDSVNLTMTYDSIENRLLQNIPRMIIVK